MCRGDSFECVVLAFLCMLSPRLAVVYFSEHAFLLESNESSALSGISTLVP